MKIAFLLTVLAILVAVGAEAQTAAQLDENAAAAALGTVPARPRLVPKGPPSPIVQRTYQKGAKGLEVEIVEHESGTREEINFVNVPVLFVKDQDELFDNVSRENVRKIAEIMLAALKQSPEAKFQIEGHTSAEGSDDHNKILSELRANRIYRLLTQDHGVPATALPTVEGLGAEYARFPKTAPESDLERDRRVIIARPR
jgi:outer membrane protein OmpA-like peptidoglycan-associated protein